MIFFQIPIKTISESNCSEHWTKKSKRHKQQQLFVRLAMTKERIEWPLPCDIKLSRLSPHQLDDDNLRSSLKWVRDEVSEIILGKTFSKDGTKVLKGRKDDDPRLNWIYGQEKAKKYGVRIEISQRATP